jgi:hypothetical protein
MSCVGFEPTVPVFERAKTIRALECVAAVIGTTSDYTLQITVTQTSVLNLSQSPLAAAW